MKITIDFKKIGRDISNVFWLIFYVIVGGMAMHMYLSFIVFPLNDFLSPYCIVYATGISAILVCTTFNFLVAFFIVPVIVVAVALISSRYVRFETWQ